MARRGGAGPPLAMLGGWLWLLVACLSNAAGLAHAAVELQHPDCEGCVSARDACWSLVSGNSLCDALPAQGTLRLGLITLSGAAETQCQAYQLWRERLHHIYGGIPTPAAGGTELLCPVFSILRIPEGGDNPGDSFGEAVDKVGRMLDGELGTLGGVDILIPGLGVLPAAVAAVAGEARQVPTIAAGRLPDALMRCVDLQGGIMPADWVTDDSTALLFPPCSNPGDKRFSHLFSAQNTLDSGFVDFIGLVSRAFEPRTMAVVSHRTLLGASLAMGVASEAWAKGMDVSYHTVAIDGSDKPSAYEYLFNDHADRNLTEDDWAAQMSGLVSNLRDNLRPQVMAGALSPSACQALLAALHTHRWQPEVLVLQGCGKVPFLGPSNAPEDIRWVTAISEWLPLETVGKHGHEAHDPKFANLFFLGSDDIVASGTALAGGHVASGGAISQLFDHVDLNQYIGPEEESQWSAASNMARAFLARWGVPADEDSAAHVAVGYIAARAAYLSRELVLHDIEEAPSQMADLIRDMAAQGSSSMGGRYMRVALGSFAMETSFYGPINLGVLGYNVDSQTLTWQMDSQRRVNVLSPIEVATGRLFHPIPAWDDLERNYPCPAGTHVAGSNHWCESQPEGDEPAPPGCALVGGVWWADTWCEACEEGTYAPLSSMVSCLPCVDGDAVDNATLCVALPPAAKQDNTSWLILWTVLGCVVGMIILMVLIACVRSSSSYARMRERIRKASPPPAGSEITVVVTDIQASTSLWEWNAEVMDAALMLHHDLLRSVLPECCGFEVTTEGDSFTVVFHEPQDAIEWCIEVQSRLMNVDWPDKLLALRKEDAIDGLVSIGDRPVFRGLRVRMGVHSGVPKVVTKAGHSRVKYKGEVVSLAKNISDTGAGGQVVVSLSTLSQVVRTELPTPTEVFNMGVHKVKGVAGVVQLVQVVPSHLLGRIQSFDSPNGELETETTVSPSFFHAPCGQESADAALRFWASSKAEEEASADDPWALAAIAGHLQPLQPAATTIDAPATQPDKVSSKAKERWKLISSAVADTTEGKPGGLRKLKAMDRWRKVSSLVHRAESKVLGTSTFNVRRGSEGMGQSSPYAHITLVFINVDRAGRLFDWDFKETNHAIETLMLLCVGDLLREHQGYPCEEEDGQLVLAFHCPLQAILYCVKIQEDALDIDWSDRLLAQAAASEVAVSTPSGGSKVLFRGLRVKCGVVRARPHECRPDLRTGRARYTGPVMNRTARFCGMAAGGQVLVEHGTVIAAQEEDKALFDAEVVMKDLGTFQLKGVKDDRLGHTVQVSRKLLADRHFPKIRKPKVTTTALNLVMGTSNDDDEKPGRRAQFNISQAMATVGDRGIEDHCSNEMEVGWDSHDEEEEEEEEEGEDDEPEAEVELAPAPKRGMGRLMSMVNGHRTAATLSRAPTTRSVSRPEHSTPHNRPSPLNTPRPSAGGRGTGMLARRRATTTQLVVNTGASQWGRSSQGVGRFKMGGSPGPSRRGSGAGRRYDDHDSVNGWNRHEAEPDPEIGRMHGPFATRRGSGGGLPTSFLDDQSPRGGFMDRLGSKFARVVPVGGPRQRRTSRDRRESRDSTTSSLLDPTMSLEEILSQRLHMVSNRKGPTDRTSNDSTSSRDEPAWTPRRNLETIKSAHQAELEEALEADAAADGLGSRHPAAGAGLSVVLPPVRTPLRSDGPTHPTSVDVDHLRPRVSLPAPDSVSVPATPSVPETPRDGGAEGAQGPCGATAPAEPGTDIEAPASTRGVAFVAGPENV